MLSPFAHAVASFDPLPDRVLLWTRVDAPAGATVTWHVALAPGADEIRVGTVAVPVDADGCVTVEVTGLSPATSYHYWFDLDGVLSPIGRTRTLPDGPTPWLRLAVVCCADRSMGALDAYRGIAEDEVDLVVHVGDYIYETAKGPHPADPERSCVTLTDYRLRHAHTRADLDLQAMHLRHPVVFVWDDHDVADNAWRHGAKEHDPEAQGPWEQRLRAATQARSEWLPARLPPGRDPIAMWRSVVIGDLAELVVLDTRIPGRDEQWGEAGAKDLHDPDRRLLEPEQSRWLRERVRDRTRPWCLVVSQVPVSDLELPIPSAPAEALFDAIAPSGYRIVDGDAVCTDLWEGYPVERDALRDAIRDRGAGVVILSGDVHSNWATFVTDGDDGTPIATELIVTSVSASPMGEQLPPGWRTVAEEVAEEVRCSVWRDLEHHGYLKVDVRPDEVRADWFACESTDRDVTVERLASWATTRTMPPQLRPATPDAPLQAFADVRRPGLPIDHLPPPEPESDPSPGWRTHVSVPTMAALGAFATVVAAALVARARRRTRRR